MQNKRAIGFKNEDTLLPIIQQYWKDSSIVKITSKFAQFDYRGNNTLYELKTRLCNKDKYATTIFPTKKFTFEPATKKVLIFSFDDGNYYIEYNESFDSFKKETKQFRKDRGSYDKPVEYIHIPVENLIKMV